MTFFEFDDGLVVLEIAGQIGSIGAARHIEQTGAQRPPILIPFHCGAIGEAPQFGTVIEGAGFDDGPIQEVILGVVGIGVGVENIGNTELADGDRDVVGLMGAGQLVDPVLHIDGFPAFQIIDIAAEETRIAIIGQIMSGLVGFTRGVGRHAIGRGRTVALIHFRVEINLQFPKPYAQIQGGIGGFGHLLFAEHTLRAIGNVAMEGAVTLGGVGALDVQAEPVGNFDQRCGRIAHGVLGMQRHGAYAPGSKRQTRNRPSFGHPFFSVHTSRHIPYIPFCIHFGETSKTDRPDQRSYKMAFIGFCVHPCR